MLVVKNLPANGGDTRDAGLISGLGRSPGGGCGNPLQYSGLENPMDREAWRATIHGVTKSPTQLNDFTSLHGGKKHRHPQELVWVQFQTPALEGL